MGLAKLTEQNGGQKVNDNEDIRVSVVKNWKIMITTRNTILAARKLLTTFTNIIQLDRK